MVHQGQGTDHPHIAECAGQIEQHDIELCLLFSHITVKVLHRVLRLAFDDRIGLLRFLLVLAVKGHFQGIVFLDAFQVTVPHQTDTVLGRVTIHHGNVVSPLVTQNTGREHGEGGLADSSFLAGKCDKQRFFFHMHFFFIVIAGKLSCRFMSQRK